jgi:hypothetical protein
MEPAHFSGTSMVVSKAVPKSYIAASEYEAQFWFLLRDHGKLLLEVKDLSSNNNAIALQKEVETIVDSIEKLNSDKTMIDGEICTSRELSILLLSRKDDLERQLAESKQILMAHFDKNHAIEDIPSKSDALDIASEKVRRRLVNKALCTQKALARLKDAVILLNSIVKKPTSAQASLFSWTPSRHAKKAASAKGPKVLFEHLKTGYDRSKRLENLTQSLHNKVEEYSQGIGKSSSIITLKPIVIRNRRGRRKITALPSFSSPTSFTNNSKSNSFKRLSTVEALQSLKNCHQTNPKQFQVRHLHMQSGKKDSNATLPSWRSNNSSQLMDLSSPLVNKSSGMAHVENASRALTLPENTARTGWTSTDIKAMESSKLVLPTSLQRIDASKAAKEALVPFGVTPEKMSSVHMTLQRGAAKKQELNVIAKNCAVTSVGAKIDVGRKQSSSFSVPPMAAMTPTPFEGQSGLDKSKSKNFSSKPEKKQAGVSQRNSNQKQSSAAAFPPMSSNAPTPFGTTKLLKKEESKKEIEKLVAVKSSLSFTKPSDSEEAESLNDLNGGADVFGGMGILGNSLGGAVVDQSQFGSANTITNFGLDGDVNDYKSILSKFYQTHNVSKLSEVDRTLQKYKVRLVTSSMIQYRRHHLSYISNLYL